MALSLESWSPSRALRSQRRRSAVDIALLVLTAATLSCDSRRAAGGRDASVDSSSGSGEAASEAAVDIAEAVDVAEEFGEVGRTIVGVYTCCAPNEAKACCAGIAQGLCYQYGGVVGRCLNDGESFDGKDICSLCCSGLSRGHPAALSDGGTACESTAPASIFVCLRCGDGVCGEFENHCTCPADCPAHRRIEGGNSSPSSPSFPRVATQQLPGWPDRAFLTA
jgi:hypothetical protein